MLGKLIKYLLAWRLAILIIAAFAVYLLPTRDCCQSFGSALTPNYLFNIWSNFAGEDFINIARLGYGAPLKPGTYVFFPFFSIVIRQIAAIIPNYLASGLVLVHLSLVIALYFLYRLVRLDYNDNIAKNSLALLLLFPTAFFFGAVYTESFFLLLVVLSFYLARRQRFFLACLMALFASATRFAGIFLWPALIWEIWQGHVKRVQKEGLDSSLIWLVLPPLGLMAYMKYLQKSTGDALMFLKTSPDFGPNLIITKLVLLHQVFYRYTRMLVFSSHTDITFMVILLEFLVGVLFLALTLIALKKLRPSYAIFMFLSYLIPTLAGTFVSLPRYMLTVFPGFIILAAWYTRQSQLMKRFYIALNLAFAVVLIVLFTRGYFVG